MAISCTPADLAAAAKCFQCLPSEEKQWIDTYLLAVIAKGSTDPNTLAASAKCFQCIPSGMLRRIQAYLLCQIASGGRGACPQDMQVSWTPTNVKLAELTGFVSQNGGGQGITTITFSTATSVDGYDIELWNDLISASFPSLVSIDPSGNSGGLHFILCPLLDSFSAPLLSVVGNVVDFEQNNSLTSISLPSIVTAGSFFVDSNAALTTVSLPNYLPSNGLNQVFTGNALTAASVNHLLARCVANPAYVSGNVNLSGGTNAAPSGQGIADKATLIGRGVNVTTN